MPVAASKRGRSPGRLSRAGKITGGAELATQRRAHVVRRGPNGTALVTDGPYAESAEQLSGFYLVTTEFAMGLTPVLGAMLDAQEAAVTDDPAALERALLVILDRLQHVTQAIYPQIDPNPRGYYANLHNAEFPGGAIRGQLFRLGGGFGDD